MQALIVLMLVTAFGQAESGAKVAQPSVICPESAPTNAYVLIDASSYSGTLGWSVADRAVSVFRTEDNKQVLLYCKTAKQVRIKFTCVNGSEKSTESFVISFSPTPVPTPVNPVPTPSAFANQVKQKAMSVPATNHEIDKNAIITVLRSLQQDLHKINLADSDVVCDSITKQFLTLTPTQQQTWLPVFGKWWTEQVDARFDEKSLSTIQQWDAFIEETCVGLSSK